MSEYSTPQQTGANMGFEAKVHATLNAHRTEAISPIWMNDNVMALGVEMSSRLPINPEQWAAAMATVRMDDTGQTVRFHVSSPFRRHYIIEKLGSLIAKHFSGKKVEYLVEGK